MRLYPLFADLRARPVLVVGGGGVAERKIETLLAAGADLTVGAPLLTPHLNALVAAGRLRHRQGEFAPQWLDGQWLLVVATSDAAINRRVAELASARQLLVNVVDDAALSTFHVPAMVDRSPLVIAISSGGSAPALARLVRARIETSLDHSLGSLAALAARFRARIKARVPESGPRRRFYAWLWSGPVARLLRAGQAESAAVALASALASPGPVAAGSVALVGAGPGSPELLTLGALRHLQEADVILYDRLVSDEILALARRDAERIAVGKQAGGRQVSQGDIHALMERHAHRGRRVVRLKGGDPFIFGRGGEELEFLRSRHIPYEVVPGITAASACAAYAGIPLTHREHSQAVRLVTAHCRESLDLLDWRALAQEKQTLAVYMGVAQFGRLQARLIAQGRSGATPFAIVENGARPEQRVITGRLSELDALARRHEVISPALLFIGEVAALATRLAWFGTPPDACSRDMTRAA